MSTKDWKNKEIGTLISEAWGFKFNSLQEFDEFNGNGEIQTEEEIEELAQAKSAGDRRTPHKRKPVPEDEKEEMSEAEDEEDTLDEADEAEEEIDEGLVGAAMGGAMGGPVGAYAGHKLQQSLSGDDEEEEEEVNEEEVNEDEEVVEESEEETLQEAIAKILRKHLKG